MKDHFTDTVSGSDHRIFLLGDRDPGGRSHLHDSSVGVLEIAIICVDRFMIRSGNCDIDTFSIQPFDQGIRSSLAAVSQWFDDHFCIFMCGKNAGFDSHAGFHGSHASFK